jgi:hypothetical protein
MTSFTQAKINLGNGWYRYFLYFTPNTTATYNIYIRANGNTNWDFDCLINAPQLEQKAFETSFANGQRSLSNLAYPSSIIQGALKGTVAFWFKPNRFTAGYEAIMRASRWGTSGDVGWGILKNSGNTNVYFEYGTFGVSVVSASVTNALTLNQWHYIVARWDTTKVSIDVFKEDGTRLNAIGTGSVPTIKYVDPIQIGVTPVSGSYPVNALYDELRIDTDYISDDEILSWYKGNAPFYNYLDYLGEVY